MFTQTEKYLLDKYQTLALDAEQLAEVMRMKDSKCVLNAISADRFPVKTYKLGKKRVADVRDVAAYIDSQRSAA